MTRYLAEALTAFEDGGNEQIERLFAYHQATKHTYRSVRTNARSLDWRNQPNPFRTYDEAALIPLPAEPELLEVGTFATIAALADKDTASATMALDVNWLSSLLWHSMAVNSWKKIPTTGARYSLRVNPSSGNLHPTECYVATRDFHSLDDGLYHYRADRHALEVRGTGDWTSALARDLDIPWAENGALPDATLTDAMLPDAALIVGLTSIFWREAWKYGERAYRYCCHDMGHATMSMLLAARALGLSGGAVAHFSDTRLTHALGLAASHPGPMLDEAPMVFLVFRKTSSEQFLTSVAQRLPGEANDLSPAEVRHPLLLGMHRAAILPDPPGPLPIISDESELPVVDAGPSRQPARDAPLGPTVRRRRSALDFDPATSSMPSDDLNQLVDFAARDWFADWRGNWGARTTNGIPGVDFVDLYLYVHRVAGYESGIYSWDQRGRSLVQLHAGNVQKVAAFLSLEQELAGHACFAVSMIADLAKAAQIFGNRAYRYVHFEAGAIGQRLYLGAEALGWNATGIGAFYDDDVHRYLGFLAEDDAAGGATLPQQVIYHFAVGRAIFDPRIEADQALTAGNS